MSGERTLNTLLEGAASVDTSGIRFVDRRERAELVTWAQIHDRALAVAGRLRAAGVEPGEPVALVYPTGPEFFDAFFGVLAAGGVPAPLYPPFRLGRLDEYHRRSAAMIRCLRARLVLTDRRIRRLLGETIERARPELGLQTVGELPAGQTEIGQPRPDDLALVQFSSGTTVDPKPVALSHRAILAQVEALNGHWPDREDLRHSGVSWLPLYHDMGLIGCVFPALERRADLTLIPPEVFVTKPATWLRVISRYRATISPAPNFAYSLCVERIDERELEGVDLSSWRVALNGAEAVAADVLRAFAQRFERWGLRPEALTPVYGLSEASLAVTFSRLDRPFVSRAFDRDELTRGRAVDVDGGLELVSNGRPLAGVELAIRGEDGQSLGERNVGRLWVRSPALMSGYLNDPEATTKAVRGGWLDTGDLGFVMDGELYLTGRAKDVLVLHGRNHGPDELERSMDEIEDVRTGCAAAATHLPEHGTREELVVFVERRKGSSIDPERLARRCRRVALARTGLNIDRVVVVEPGTLPRTSSGKIRRRDALERYRRGELEPPKRVGAAKLARAMIRSSRALNRAKRSRRAAR